MKKFNKNNLMYICFLCLIILILLFLKPDNNFIIISSIVIVLLLIISVTVWIVKYKKINTPVFYFLFICYISWFGQFVLVLFNSKNNGNLFIFSIQDIEGIKTAVLYSIIGYGALFLGALVNIRSQDELLNLEYYKDFKDKDYKKAVVIVAVIMIIIGMPQFLIKSISNLRVSFSDSYLSLYEIKESDSLSNITSNLRMFFIPGIIMLMIAMKDNKKIFKTCLLIVLYDFIVSFACGGRGSALVLLLTAFWINFSQIRKIKVKNLIILCMIGLIVLKLFNVVAIYRVKSNKDVNTFFESMEESSENGVISSTIKEIGGNIFSLYHTMKIIPEYQDFSYGYSYFASFIAVVPSIVFGGYSFTKDAALANWLMTQLDLDYGPGYTILAESYYNFGFLGFIAMFLIGIIYAKNMKNNKHDENDDEIIIKNIKVGIFMYIGLLTFRGSILLVFRYYFYTIFIPFLLIKILKNTIKKNKGRDLV
ncbi:MAG: O-antigen polysaccharide polymerase Wzy [Clostridia bacterium]|nr:O-antigen polysaccharide polymerase Wzy [Clostridia bacterium]